MRAMVAQAYRRLGHPEALSWVTVAVVLVLQLAGSALSAQVDIAGRELEFLALRTLAVLCISPAVFLGRLGLQKFAGRAGTPILTLFTFVVALLITTTVFDGLLVATGFAERSMLAQRLITSAPGVLAALILSSLLVTYAREFSDTNEALRTTVDELLLTRAEASTRIADRQAELITSIRAEIDDELANVGHTDAADDAARMRSLIDDVVRPISYSLARGGAAESAIEPERTYSRIDWRSVTRHAMRSNPFHWIATPTLMGLFAASFYISTYRLGGTLATVVLVAGIAAVSWIARRLWAHIPFSTPVWARAAAYTLTTSALALAIAPFTTALTGYSFTASLRLISWVLIMNIAAWTVTLVLSVNELLRDTNNRLLESIDELKREVIALSAAHRQLQRGISHVLHGPVQSAITSALLRLQSGGAKLTDAGISEELRARISSALDTLSEPSHAITDLRLLLDDLVELWSGAVEIHATCSDDDHDTIHQQPVTAYAVAEIVREACSNAIRHGNANRIDVSIRVSPEDRTAEVIVTNNGAPFEPGAPPGLGSQLLDEVALDWRREHVGQRVQLVARVPMEVATAGGVDPT